MQEANEIEQAWEEVLKGSIRSSNKKDEPKVSRCSMCKKKTKRLTHIKVGAMNAYLCNNCMMMHRMAVSAEMA